MAETRIPPSLVSAMTSTDPAAKAVQTRMSSSEGLIGVFSGIFHRTLKLGAGGVTLPGRLVRQNSWSGFAFGENRPRRRLDAMIHRALQPLRLPALWCGAPASGGSAAHRLPAPE